LKIVLKQIRKKSRKRAERSQRRSEAGKKLFFRGKTIFSKLFENKKTAGSTRRRRVRQLGPQFLNPSKKNKRQKNIGGNRPLGKTAGG
jgi:hypothetical protein